ncbi:MAG: precorrin-3B C(17)-methyltransferase [Muribaculaceae bacterium]|jgi:precorrin-3B C17-methyltransferase|nr:precorrin-3B C(17)-methyltransferase [Muribaculaceae bacterium]
MKPKITVIGIGPGKASDMTAAAIDALRQAEVVVGYKYYIPFIAPMLRPDVTIIQNGMKQEQARIEKAFEIAETGKDVCVISSGDSGIYGMAPLVYEMLRDRVSDIEVEVIPGISAFQKAASLLGAPIGHDFCVISLSDLMTPWSLIERRIKAAVDADFITAVYNPKSTGRYWELYRLKELFLVGRSPETPVGFVRQAGRKEEKVTVTTLREFDPEEVDMFTVVIIGNSQSYIWSNHFTTPRGYYRFQGEDAATPGQSIMIESFRTIEKEMANPAISLDLKWPMLHAIHTTADFDMENIVKADSGAVEKIYHSLTDGGVNTIVTDVTMAASGIRKGALERLGVQVKCYLNDAATTELAREKGITRTQAGIRRAVAEHPDALYVFGNAPTALMELCTLIRHKKADPCGIVAAPVGFVHVCESKHMLKPFTHIPKIIVEGRKGGSNLAATLVNSILCWPDAQLLKPGRDV